MSSAELWSIGFECNDWVTTCKGETSTHTHTHNRCVVCKIHCGITSIFCEENNGNFGFLVLIHVIIFGLRFSASFLSHTHTSTFTFHIVYQNAELYLGLYISSSTNHVHTSLCVRVCVCVVQCCCFGTHSFYTMWTWAVWACARVRVCESNRKLHRHKRTWHYNNSVVTYFAYELGERNGIVEVHSVVYAADRCGRKVSAADDIFPYCFDL